METPTTAPVVDLKVGDRTYQLYLGFRAFKKLGMNPFKPEEGIAAYLSDLNLEKAFALIQAGIENAKVTLKIEQGAPTEDELVDNLDFFSFSDKIRTALGEQKAPAETESGVKLPNP